MTKEVLPIFFDVETCCEGPIDSPHKDFKIWPYLIGWTEGGHSEVCMCEGPWVFIQRLAELSKSFRLVLYGYNVSYDLHVLLPYLIETPWIGMRHRLITFYTASKNVLSFRFISKHLRFSVADLWQWNKSWSLAKWMKELHMDDKDPIEYNKHACRIVGDNVVWTDLITRKQKTCPLAVEEKYLRKDVLALPRVLEHIWLQQQGLCNDIGLTQKALEIKSRGGKLLKIPSIPGFTKRNLTSLMKKDFDSVYRPAISHQEYVIQTRSHMGGYTCFNPQVSRAEGTIKSYDINSQYPSIMIEWLPAGERLLVKPEGRYAEWHYCHLIKANWKPSYASVLSTKPFKEEQIGQRIFILKDYLDFLSNYADLELELLEVSYQVKVAELTDYMGTLYYIKSTTSDSSLRSRVKLAMNNVYGKLCERSYKKKYSFGFNNKEEAEFSYEVDEEAVFKQKLTGTYVTSIARIRLFEAMFNEIDNGNVVLYVDTDSIKTLEVTPPSMFVHPDELGAWKDEGTFDLYLNNFKKKKYALINRKTGDRKVAFSGVKEGWLKTIKKAPLKTLETLLDPYNNVAMLYSGTNTVRNKVGAPVLFPTDVRTGKQVGSHTHVAWMSPEGQILVKNA